MSTSKDTCVKCRLSKVSYCPDCCDTDRDGAQRVFVGRIAELEASLRAVKELLQQDHPPKGILYFLINGTLEAKTSEPGGTER